MRPLLLLSVLALAAACMTACDPKTDFPAIVALATPPGGPAPSWRLKDPDGNVISSEQFKGKVVVLDFWATWCVPCRIEIPGYIELQKKYGKEGLVIIGVSVDQEGPAVVKKFVADFGINYPVVMADDDIANAFGGVDAYPTTYIIDRDGVVRDRKIGVQATAKFEKRILAWLRPAGGK